MRLLTAFSITCMLLISFSACSGSSNPVTPGHLSNDTETASSDNYHQTEYNYDGVFGAWMVHVDTDNLTAEILPARNASAIGDIFDADLSQFLTVSPCSNCMTISHVGIDGYGDLALDLTIRHPFDNITTRPDLHGFDVRAIFIFEQVETISDMDIQMMHPDGTEETAEIGGVYTGMLNPDGYTSHFDSLVEDPRYFINHAIVPGNLNPFLRFFDNAEVLDFDPHAPDGHNVMPVGSSNYTRTAKFDLESFEDGLDFYVIADCAYGQSAVFTNRSDPQYYLPAFHRTEPWRVEYYFENHDITSLPGTTSDIIVQVFDWQQGATVDPEYPNPANLAGIRESSDVMEVEMFFPGMSDSLYSSTSFESGTGAPDDPLQYRIEVTNEDGAMDNVAGILAVRDELYGQAAPAGRYPIPVAPSGFPYNTPDIRDYAIYLPVVINVRNPWITGDDYTNGNEIVIPSSDLHANERVTTIHPTFFMDQGHEKFLYEWDSDYDGSTFDIEATGLPSPEVTFSTGGRKDVGFRVTTNTVPPQQYTYTLPINAEGASYENERISPAAQQDTTSSVRNHAMDTTNDNCYIVYTHEEGGQRDIYLAIINKATGDVERFRVTDTANASFSPSIFVTEYGIEPGVYVAYCEYDGANSAVYTTWGNLDGSGFSPANNRRVTATAAPSEYRPILGYLSADTTLFCYYQVQTAGPVTAHLHGAHSLDFADTWVEDGRIADNGSDIQTNLTIAYTSITMRIYWEDYINALSRGADLWKAVSHDGIGNFDNQQIFSISTGIESEVNPCANYIAGDYVVAYQSIPDIGELSSVEIIVEKAGGTALHYRPLRGEYSTTYTQPAVHGAIDNRLILAAGSYHTGTEELTAEIYELRLTSTGTFVKQRLFEYPAGTIAASAANIFPAVLCERPLTESGCVENLVIWRDFANGSLTSAIDPVLTFGELAMTSFISDADYD